MPILVPVKGRENIAGSPRKTPAEDGGEPLKVEPEMSDWEICDQFLGFRNTSQGTLDLLAEENRINF